MQRLASQITKTRTPARSPSDSKIPVPVDRRSFDQCARADLEQILSSASTQDVETKEWVDLVWEYFAAGYAAGTESDQRKTLPLENLDSATDIAADAIAVEVLDDSRNTEKRITYQQVDAPRDPAAEMVAALSYRRFEVLRLVARGLTNREIASVLDISSHTVKSHMTALFESLDVSNRTEAAYALQSYEEVYVEESSD